MGRARGERIQRVDVGKVRFRLGPRLQPEQSAQGQGAESSPAPNEELPT